MDPKPISLNKRTPLFPNPILPKNPNLKTVEGAGRKGKTKQNQKIANYNRPTPQIHVAFHFEGRFHQTARWSKYIGGKQFHISGVKRDVFTYHNLRSVLRKEGVKNPFRLYKFVDGGFILIGDDKALSNLFDEKIGGDGRLSLYVDELNNSVSTEQEAEIVDEVGDRESIEDMDDVEINLDDEELQDSLDDHFFDDNVDLDVEWLSNFSSHRDMLQISKEKEQKQESDDSSEDDVVISDGEMNSGKDSDDDSDYEVRKHQLPLFNPTDLYDPEFKIGMNFENKQILRRAIHSHAVRTKRNIQITKNDNRRVHAKCCNADCEWKLHALPVKGDTKFQIRKYDSHHTCAKSFQVKNMNANWIAGRYLGRFKSDPNRSIKGFREDVIAENQCQVSEDQAYRAKRKALEILEGDFVDQYSLLWDFIEEVKRSNPGSTLILKTEDAENEDGENEGPRFDKMYMCLDALKKGFFNGCRPFLGLDGCHLKGPHGGVLLSAIGVDPNNNIFPLAIAVVSKEDRITWEWFLTLLKEDLNITEDYSWTFMSDKQKGLIRAMNEVFPNATHRFCVRHLVGNFKRAGFIGHDLKCALWKASKAFTPNEFEARMAEMKHMKEAAAKWLEDKPPHQWSRAYFNDIPKVDSVENNGSESFNKVILKAREKCIVSMLEWILEYLMKRMQKNRDSCRKKKWKGPVCPNIQEILNKSIDKVGDCIPIKSDKLHYQINCSDGSKYAVDLEKRTCGCRKWDISALPCKHAISAIFNEKLSYHDFVDVCYKLVTYKKVYAPVIMPINGRSEWRKTGIIPPQPPNDRIRGVGRLETARRRAFDEPAQKSKKRSIGKPKGKVEQSLQRQQISLKCGSCGTLGHNKKTCHKHTTPVPNDQVEHEEIEVSQYMTTQCSENGGKLNVEVGESSRCPKLQVKRKSGDIERNELLVWRNKCLKTAPTPYEQLQDCQDQNKNAANENEVGNN